METETETENLNKNITENKTVNTSLSRFGFLFLIFAVVSSGYVTEILSCQMRKVLETSMYFRHLIGVIIFFVFIMLEGGWSFNTKVDNMFSNNWSSGNVLDTIIIAFILYIIFLLSAKSQFKYNIIFFGLVFILYFINTQRDYWYQRNIISEKSNKYTLHIEYILFFLSILFLIIGFIDYVIYQKKEYKNKFNWLTFLLGSHNCSF
jgi:hypothetical protein